MDMSVLNGALEISKEVTVMHESVDGSDSSKRPLMLGTRAADQHRDPSILKLAHDLTEGMRAGRVQHLHIVESHDDDSNVGNTGQFGQKALRRTEEDRAVESIDRDVVGQRSSVGVAVVS